jgi:hypothetical protein
MNILIVGNSLKNFTFFTIYKENLILKKRLTKHNFYFWGPGFNFSTNDTTVIVEYYKKRGILIDLIYLNLNQQDLIGKYNYKSIPKKFYKIPFKYFPVNLNKVAIPKVLLIVDFWVLNKYEWEYVLRKNDICFVFSAHLNFELKKSFNDTFMTPFVKNNIKFFQYFRTLEEKKRYRADKDLDVVSLGQKWKKFYPNRIRFDNELFKMQNDGLCSFFTASHPGYTYKKNKNTFVGSSYFRLLSRSKILLTDSTFFGTHLIKTIEAFYYRCVYLTDKIHNPKFNFLRKNFNYVEVNINNIRNKITNIIKNKKMINSLIKNGYSTYKLYYSNSVFVKRMDKYFNEILELSRKKKFNSHQNNFLLTLKIKIVLCKILIISKKILFKIFNIQKFTI